MKDRFTKKHQDKNIIILDGFDYHIKTVGYMGTYISGYAADKLAAYEDAEAEGHILRCPKCGSLRIRYSSIASEYGDCNCECLVCGHGW